MIIRHHVVFKRYAMTFVNFSNHPSYMWGSKQFSSGEVYGDIVDLPFPSVPATFNETQISSLAAEYVDKILALDPSAVMCQGEYTLSFAVAKRLTHLGIPVFSACSERGTEDIIREDGSTIRSNVFKFVQFRQYDV